MVQCGVVFHLSTKKRVWRTKRHNLQELLLLAIIVVVVLHIFWQIVASVVGADNRITTDLAGRFGLDDELSVPTWLAAALALLLAGLAFIVAKSQANIRQQLAWYCLAMLGLAISIDEVAALHELLLQGLHILAQFGEGQDFVRNAWLLVLPFIFVAIVLVVRFWAKSLPVPTLRRLIFGLGIYLLGAVVVEYVSIRFDKSGLSYNVGVVTLEESLELIGLWLLIRAVLLHINDHQPRLRKQLTQLISS